MADTSSTRQGQGLYQHLKLPKPDAPAKEPFPILIYGGSTAMGVSGIQYAKLSGATVITTSSPHNFDYLRSLGADHVFDYNDESSPEKIRELTGGKLHLAWDCQSTEQSAVFVAKAMNPEEGGRVGTLLPVPQAKVSEVNAKVEAQNTLYYTAFGEPFTYFGVKPAVPEDLEFAKDFWELSRKLYAEGKVKPVRVIKNRGGEGLEGVLEGLKELKAGKVSGGKLVYTL
jgi:NADPH:quinone reductase-like Zn-dependent oxidoreductase